MRTEPAAGLGDLPAAGESWRVSYPSTSVTGAPVDLTGLVHLPKGDPPPGGWPVATYGHMTTGGGDRAAPSLAGHGHPETGRMTVGDPFVSGLLDAGIVVLRPDYEGLGSPGPHPYLVGPALGRSVVDLLVAARAQDRRLGADWVSSGHSEGAVAAVHAARIGAPGVTLRALSIFAPVTRMDLTIGAVARSPRRLPGQPVVPPLIALMVSGAMSEDPAVAALARDGGLSARALELWPDLELCLEEMAAPGSFGDLVPQEIWGRRGRELRAALYRCFRRHDVRRHPPAAHVMTRVDAALWDEVAPLPLTHALVRRWRRAGSAVELRRWPTSHSGVLTTAPFLRGAVAWVERQLTAASTR